MAKSRLTGKESDDIKGLINLHEEIQNKLNKEMETSRGLNDLDKERQKLAESIGERQRLINELKMKENKLGDKNKKILSDLIAEQDEAIKNEKEINKQLTKQEYNRKRINAALSEANRLLKEGWKYLMESDKVIKSTILNLGLSGVKAENMRLSFEQSAGAVASMGGNLEDVQKIMEGFADETGKARVLSAQMVEDITAIGKGTGLGVEQAAKLGAQFEFMGLDAKKTVDYVQGIVDTSERMGINTTKVLKNINDNFKKVNTFTFQKGSKGIAEMAMNAEKTRVSMSTALDVAEATRSLDKVIELGANLQVMGGEFAKMDPFEWLYNARNEPEKMTEKISEMTRGLYTFKKMSDGTFEKFISPADRDRLASVAQSLGISKEEIFQIAERRLDMDKMSQDMQGMGLTKREKELIQGAAVMNSNTAKYQVNLAGTMRDISSLTADQAKSFASEQVLLKDRAKEALTFDEAFKATINELKSALLPILRGVNGFLGMIRPYVESFTKLMTQGPAGWAKVAALFLGVGMVWKGILQPFMQKIGDKTIGALSSRISGRGPTSAPIGGGGGAIKSGIGGAAAGIGAGIGAAALGAGAGIGAAAAGISLLANAMSKLDEKKVKALQDIVKSISWVVGIAAVASAAIIGIGMAMGAAAPEVGLFGLAVLGIGAGIGIAATGIGFMATGLATLVTAGKDAGASMISLGLGMAAISASLVGMTFGIGGLFMFNKLMSSIAEHAPDLEKVGGAFKQINAVMSGNKEDFAQIEKTVNAISNMNSKGGSTFAELANLLKTPLKVQFADKEVGLVSNITLNVDGNKVYGDKFQEKVRVSLVDIRDKKIG